MNRLFLISAVCMLAVLVSPVASQTFLTLTVSGCNPPFAFVPSTATYTCNVAATTGFSIVSGNTNNTDIVYTLEKLTNNFVVNATHNVSIPFGEYPVNITVTDKEHKAKNTYVVVFRRPGANPLASLSATGININYAPFEFVYTGVVNNPVAFTSVSGACANSGDRLIVKGQNVSANVGVRVNLTVGNNDIDVACAGADAVTDFKITITRLGLPTLTSLSVSNVREFTFDPKVTTYSLTPAHEHTNFVVVTPKTAAISNNNNNTIPFTVNGVISAQPVTVALNPSGTTAVSVAVGDSTLGVNVYVLNINKQASLLEDNEAVSSPVKRLQQRRVQRQ